MPQYRKELAVRCAPDVLWHALSEPAGLQSWFAPEARVTPGLGGSVWVSWGPGMEGESSITAWDPPRRFAYSMDMGPGAEPNVVNYDILPEGETTRLVLTQTGLPNEAALAAVAQPWELFLHLLKHGCEHPHRSARNVTVARQFDLPVPQLWAAIRQSPAYQSLASQGRVVFETGEGFQAIEFPQRNRSITGLFCENCGDRTNLTLMSILYDPADDQVDAVRDAWNAVAQV